MKHGTPNQMQDAMNVWIEHVSTTRFEVCLQEWRKFDGPHSNLSVVSKNSVLFFTGVRHYAQHSDVEAVSWMTNIGGWIIRNYKFSSLTLRNHECWRLDGSTSTSDTLHCIHKLASIWVYTSTEWYITTILVIFITIIYLFIIVFLNLIFRAGWRTKVTIHHHGKWKYRQRSCSLRMMD